MGCFWHFYSTFFHNFENNFQNLAIISLKLNLNLSFAMCGGKEKNSEGGGDDLFAEFW